MTEFAWLWPHRAAGLDDARDDRAIFAPDRPAQAKDIGLVAAADCYTAGCSEGFAAGTLIATPEGDCRIEDLQIGDLITTSVGNAVAVKWIGRYSAPTRFGDPRCQPVRIRAGALGGGRPRRDLTLSADQAVIHGNTLVNASAMINAGTIDWLPLSEMPQQITYHHIETERHEVILANGVASETFIDHVGRATFDNFEDYLRRFGEERTIPEMKRPRITQRQFLPALLQQLLDIVVLSADLPETA